MPRIDIGDAEIQYESRGDGPPLMLVPGLGGSGSFWKNQIDEFAAHFRVVTHDHRGAGRSTHSRIAYSVDQMAADTLKLMDGLGIEAAHYAGHSTGGAIGQIIAQDAGHRLKSLVLSATWPGQDAYFNRCFEMRKLVLQTCGVLDYARISAINLWPAWWIAENDEDLSRDNRAQAADHAPVEVMASRIDAIMAFDRRAQMSEISVPTLVIVARDDVVTPTHMSDELAAGIPGARYTVLERGGHYVPVVLPEDYNPPVLDFLLAQGGL